MQKSILAAILVATASTSCAIHIGNEAQSIPTPTIAAQPIQTIKALAPLPQTQPTTVSTTIPDTQILAKAKEILAASKSMI